MTEMRKGYRRKDGEKGKNIREEYKRRENKKEARRKRKLNAYCWSNMSGNAFRRPVRPTPRNSSMEAVVSTASPLLEHVPPAAITYTKHEYTLNDK